MSDIRPNRMLVRAIARLTILSVFGQVIVPVLAAKAIHIGGPIRLTYEKQTAQPSDSLTVYGPRRFDRAAGQPVTVTDQFSLPSDAAPPYTALVQNGAPGGSGHVSSARITLNGTEIFSPRDFNQNVSSLTRTVALIASNRLEVRLASSPGSFLTITFTSARARVESATPSRALQGQTVSVALTGLNTHWAAGATRAAFGGEISVGGAGAGAPGPVTVTGATTALAQVTVSSTAALGPRAVRVVTPNGAEGRDEIATFADGFVVAAGAAPGDPRSMVSTIAGGAGIAGFADGVALQARFRDPAAVAVGPDEAVYVADAGNNRIRVVGAQPGPPGVAPAFVVSTLAGDGVAGFADGPSATARFNNPHGIAVGAGGAVFVADTGNNRIRKITADGMVSTVAGDSAPGFVDGPAGQARFNAPRGLAIDAQGNIYVADTDNSAVRVISPTGSVATLAGDGRRGSADSPNARFDGLTGVTVDGASLYIFLADAGNHRIRRVDPFGATITLTGAERGFQDGQASQGRLADPSGIAADGSVKLVIADATNSLVRLVDPALTQSMAANNAPPAVVTVAGTGEPGLTDGRGDLARFHTPKGVAVGQSSAIFIADSGNHVLRKIVLPPLIDTIAPERARPSESIILEGHRFDGRSADRNGVQFTRAGGGGSPAQVVAATRTRLTVVVPADAATGPVTVQTEGGAATTASSFEVISAAPVISDFNPKSGSVGTVVTLIGSSLKADTGPTAITFAGGGTRLPAPVTFVSATEVRAIVPNSAQTGQIELVNARGRALTGTPFTVEVGQQDYQIAVAPSTATAIQRGEATFVVYVTSGFANFSQMVGLSASGLPTGVGVTLDPPQITAGASSTLRVSLAGADISPGSYSFSVNGTALVEGSELRRAASLALNVAASGQTTLAGRVLSTDDEPIMGATVSLDGRTATTDGAGSFLLSGVAAGPDRPLMVDGRTASAPNRTYPVIIEPATIASGQANTVPFVFYLPPIDIQFEEEVVPGEDTVVRNPRAPGLKMTIPAGANLRNRDNTPVARASITPLAIDRTPAPLPAGVSTDLVFTSQPGGAIADLAMPVIYPNPGGADAGTRIELYGFDHDTVRWYIYGYGRVSADGRSIEPEVDPATGRLYGLRDFSWHFPRVGRGGNPGDYDPCLKNRTPNPVDLSTGMKIEAVVDIAFGGARGHLSLARTYTTDLSADGVIGRFGRGAKDNFDIRLRGSFSAGGSGRIIWPEQSTGRLFSYERTESDGTLVFTSAGIISQLGDQVRKRADGSMEYRFKDGRVIRFGDDGRPVSFIDPNGNVTTLTYDGGGRLTEITDAVGRSITLQYNAQNFVARATDPVGRSWQYFYTSGAAGFLERVIDPLDKVVRYSYADARLATVTDRRGNISKQISYDGAGRVSEQRMADGGFERYSYTLSGEIVTSVVITDSLGRTRSKRLNSTGYVVAQSDQLGQVTRADRDLASNLALSITGPCGCPESRRQFDDRGNLTRMTDRLGNTARFEYDPVFNNVTKVTDKLGRVTRLEYDDRGNLASVTDALNQTTAYSHDGRGQLTSVTDPLGHTSRMEYDALGNLAASTDALGNHTAYEYDGIGRLTATVDPLGRRAAISYDALYLASVTDPAGAITRFTFDANGNRTVTTDALGRRWSAAFDAKNRPVSTTDPLGRASRREYNTSDELVSATSASGRTVRYSYDKRSQIATITDPAGGVIRLDRDHRGNLTGVTDQRGHTTSFSYDELMRPTTRRDPLGRGSRLAYDAMGNVTEGVDRLGRRKEVTYDALYRPVRVTHRDAVVTYGYDRGSRLTRIEDTQSGSIDWGYDAADRVESETTAAGVVRYEYNGAGQRTSMRAADRPPVTYGYDPAGRLQSITQGPEVFTYGYDLLSRRTSLRRPNEVTTTYSYDSVNRLTRMTHAGPHNQLLEDYRYSYTTENEIASITSIASAQLVPPAKSISPADAANQISQAGETSFSFNSVGQTTLKTGAQAVTEYEWDSRGRLIRTRLSDGPAVSYGYDPLGRLAHRTASGVTTSFLYDGPDIALDRRSDGRTIDYLSGPVVDEMLRQTSAETETFYFLQDHLRSIVALTNPDGSLLERTQYEPFGESSGSGLTRYGYTGRERDPATGLLNYRTRWYDPERGRFISEDPIGFDGGTNQYTYAGNNPISYNDPFGLRPCPKASRRGGFWDFVAGFFDAIGHPEYAMGGFGVGMHPGAPPSPPVSFYGSVAFNAATGSDWSPDYGSDWYKNGYGAGVAYEVATAVAVGAAMGAEMAGVDGLKDVTSSEAKYFRYVSQAELEAIEASGGLLRGGRSGVTYWTNVQEGTAPRAAEVFALEHYPEYRIEFEIMNKPVIEGGTKVEPITYKSGVSRTGGSREFWAHERIRARIIGIQRLNYR